MFISLVMPTYHSERFIGETIAELERYAASSPHRFELVVVDDGSLDGTFPVLRDIAASSELDMRVIQLFTNRGQFHALMAGFAHAQGDYIVTIDDDLEYRPAEIDRLIEAFATEPDRWDVVIGVPEGERKNIIRRAGSFLKNEMNTIMFRKPRHLRAGCFRMMTASFAGKLLEFRTANPVIGPLIFKATRRIKNVRVSHSAGLRKSTYSFRKLVRTFFSNMQNFSEFPLHYISMSGLALSALAILMTMYFLMRYFTGFPRPISQLGWTSLIVAVTFFSGAILFSLGFIGQYIFKIIEEVNKTPNYQIRSVVDTRAKGDTRQSGADGDGRTHRHDGTKNAPPAGKKPGAAS